MSHKLDYEPCKKSAIPFQIPHNLQLGAGPVNITPKVLDAIAHQPVIPITEPFFKMLDEIQKMAKYLLQTKNSLTVVAQVTGNGGNETMVTNLADPGETIMVAVAGVWGNKVLDMAKRYNVKTVALTRDSGEIFSLEYLEEELIKHKPVALFVTHGESSGGTLQPLEGLGDLCHKYNCLLAVDAVVSAGVEPFFMDRWGVDAVNVGTQKGVGSIPGLCIISLSLRAQQRMLAKKFPPPYTLDLKELADVWNCFGKTRSYHYTYCSNLLNGLRAALVDICEEGLVKIWARHRACADLLVSNLKRLDLKPFVEKQENRFCGVTCVVLPEGVKWPALLRYLIEKHKIELSFGIGPTQNKAIRIGFLGPNAYPYIAEYLVEALEDGLNYCKSNTTNGIDTLGLFY